MKFNNIILNNFGLKALSLILAFITLVYVGETIKTDSDDRTILQKVFSRAGYISKELTVKPIFVGEAPEGYRFLESEAKVSPETVVVIGPERFLADKKFIYTKPIHIREHTKTKTLAVELKSVSRSIKSREIKTQVFLPIEKINAEK